ncbi:MAG: TlpA disulfide reductase family protein [Myxococcota bacterium]|jgi:peroxiredoxin|nr:TlpA disulfide reductase family protein [Myxococcota bacterium]
MSRIFLAVTLLLAFTVASPALAADAGVAAADRAKVPAFRLKDLKGKKVHIKDLRGKAVVISFWATWCVPCKRELDDLAKLYKTLKKEGLEVLAIATDGPETFSEIRGVVKRHRWPFRILPDKEGEATSILNPRGTVPYTMYVDRHGRLAYDHEGYAQGDAKKMAKRIKELLAEPAP